MNDPFNSKLFDEKPLELARTARARWKTSFMICLVCVVAIGAYSLLDSGFISGLLGLMWPFFAVLCVVLFWRMKLLDQYITKRGTNEGSASD